VVHSLQRTQRSALFRQRTTERLCSKSTRVGRHSGSSFHHEGHEEHEELAPVSLRVLRGGLNQSSEREERRLADEMPIGINHEEHEGHEGAEATPSCSSCPSW
jgi:hypothetical protein